MASKVFPDRRAAGRALGRRLGADAGRDPFVFALPRGGVPVGFEVAKALHAPLDVIVVRKLGMPGLEEYAMGAVAGNGIQLLDDAIVRELGLSARAIQEVVHEALLELQRREHLYRGDRPPPAVRGRTVILVDDGLATGASMLAAVRALRVQGPARITAAVPVAAADSCAAIRAEVDALVCVQTPWPFHAVGAWYRDFSQTSDAEVCALLQLARRLRRAAG